MRFVGFCGVIFEWDSMDTVYSSTNLSRGMATIAQSGHLRGMQTDIRGYPDVIAHIELDSIRQLSIAPTHSLGIPSIVFMDFLDQQRKPLEFCPRSTLKWALNKLQNVIPSASADCGFELEWYTYRGKPDTILHGEGNAHGKAISQGMFGYSMLRPWCNAEYMSSILEHCRKSGIEIDCFHTETGPGVYEVALKYKSALMAADECQLFKYLVKNTAYHYDMTASFMAKPWNDLPGCGGHIHLSLIGPDGKNLFAVMDDKGGLPVLMRPFIAGILHCIPDLMPFFAPNINSYKRLDIRYWAPVIVGWGADNRLAVVRVILSAEEPQVNRIEIRVPGADMNPYYAAAAILSAGCYGVENKLPLASELDATALLSGDNLAKIIDEKGYRPLPATLGEATMRMLAPDSLARKILPAGLVEHFGMTRLHELKSFETTVTYWERERYLELA
jgi:glutamine synthetase